MHQNLLGARVKWMTYLTSKPNDPEVARYGTIRALWIDQGEAIAAVADERASTHPQTVYRRVHLVKLENLEVGLEPVAK